MMQRHTTDTKKKSKKKIILIIVLSLIFIWTVCFCTDWYCMKNNNNPVFVVYKDWYFDGGTIVYYGVGYKWIKYHRIPSSSIGYSSPFCDGIALKPWFADDFAGFECE
ncbi:MAG TPA: hypothetical protein DCE23_04675 [Firmicutes bacterium]|nr:hypothetical protein [Bacillota bacterium]